MEGKEVSTESRQYEWETESLGGKVRFCKAIWYEWRAENLEGKLRICKTLWHKLKTASTESKVKKGIISIISIILGKILYTIAKDVIKRFIIPLFTE